MAAPVFPDGKEISLLLCGDVMLGRGIDQILPHPSEPRLYESHMSSARDYVALAERVNGTIPMPVDGEYVWGNAAAEIGRCAPDVRIVNLETAITTNDRPEPKQINYRMHPANIGCLQAMHINCCALANNHVLDWSREGLLETLVHLDKAGIAHAGAGRTLDQAAAPAILPVADGRRVLVFGFGLPSSGIPATWAASESNPGIHLLKDFSNPSITRIADRVRAWRQPGDLLVASIHWGSNWGYDISAEQRQLAHDLIDTAGFDVIHGHSSHHPKAIEMYRGKLILYGCGDFLNDYEGIEGQEPFRSDLAVAYLVRCPAGNEDIPNLALLPYRIRKFRLQSASEAERRSLQRTLDGESRPFGVRILEQTLPWPPVSGALLAHFSLNRISDAMPGGNE
ncbi:CapA family protein [Dyella choica]|uniref:CapA family protein n=1 Tax=Dyella choica TaxID=1927959 RepID=A0A432M5X6_9GAMM|nr:CapA family protein [Dyella choica]RUL75928.1 CapA family protein [Dyella choica]